MLVHIVVGLAEEAGGAAGTIVDCLSDLRVNDFDNGADKRPGRVVFATVTASVTHTVEATFVPVCHLVTLLGGLEAESVHLLQDVAEVVAALDAVTDFGEDDTNLDFDGLRATCLTELAEVREEFSVDKVNQIVTNKGIGHVVLSGRVTGHCPIVPAVAFGNDGFVGLVLQFCCELTGFLKVVQIFEEQNPRGLLYVIKFAGAAFVGTQAVIQVLNCLLESHMEISVMSTLILNKINNNFYTISVSGEDVRIVSRRPAGWPCGGMYCVFLSAISSKGWRFCVYSSRHSILTGQFVDAEWTND